MKNRILAVICLVLTFAVALASCGSNTECEHTFSEAWASDAENHWHAATCEHGEVKDSLAAHVDADEDGKCDVCAYEAGHIHTFASEWTTDEESHWKVASCTHTAERGELGLHADDDVNGKCDVCDAHVHVLDGAGFCAGCDKEVKPVVETELGSVVSATTARVKNVISGVVSYENLITSSVTGNITASLAHNAEYSYGTNGTYVNRTLTGVDGESIFEENWIPASDSDTIIGVTVITTDGVVTEAQPTAFGPDNLLGYYFTASTLAEGYSPEVLLSELYNRAFEESINKVDNFTVEHDEENNIYAFGYGILTINTDVAEGEDDNVNYYVVVVEFTYADDYTLLSLEVAVLCYTNTLSDEAEQDFTYDQATQTITMKETASADIYHYVVTQVKGEKGEIEMNDGSEFMPDSYKIYTDEEHTTLLGDSITISIADANNDLYLVATPADAFVSFLVNNFKITVTDKDGNNANGLMVVLVGDVIQVLPARGGEYVVTFEALGITKTVNFTVEAPEIKGEYTFTVEVLDSYSWSDTWNEGEGVAYVFTPEVAGQYTFYLPANFGIYSEERESAGTAPEVDPFNVDNSGYMGYDPAVEHTVTVVLRPGQTYRFYFGATAKGTYTIGYDAP